MSNCPNGCGRPTTGDVCSVCWSRLRDDLASVAELADELITVTCRQTRYSSGGGLGVHGGGDEQPLVIDLHAAETARHLRNLLGGWVRDLHETHAIRWHECADCSARWFSGPKRHDVRMSALWCSGTWVECVDPLTVENAAGDLAGWMLRHPSWLRGHPAARELWLDVTTAISRAWRGVDKPPDRLFLGLCSAQLDVDGETVECDVDIYAVPGKDVVECHRCHARHDVRKRRAILLDAVADQLLTATDISRALPGLLDRPVTAAQIRGFAHRGKLAQHAPHPLDPRCSARYRVGDVRDLLDTLTPAVCA